MERKFENIRFRKLTTEIFDVKRKEIENGNFKNFVIDFQLRKDQYYY